MAVVWNLDLYLVPVLVLVQLRVVDAVVAVVLRFLQVDLFDRPGARNHRHPHASPPSLARGTLPLPWPPHGTGATPAPLSLAPFLSPPRPRRPYMGSGRGRAHRRRAGPPATGRADRSRNAPPDPSLPGPRRSKGAARGRPLPRGCPASSVSRPRGSIDPTRPTGRRRRTATAGLIPCHRTSIPTPPSTA